MIFTCSENILDWKMQNEKASRNNITPRNIDRINEFMDGIEKINVEKGENYDKTNILNSLKAIRLLKMFQ